MKLPKRVWSLLLSTAAAVTAFTTKQPFANHRQKHRQWSYDRGTTAPLLFLSKQQGRKQKSRNNSGAQSKTTQKQRAAEIAPPPNEFSRTVSPDKIHPKRDYQISVDASEDERRALADRFGIPLISQLRASLSLRQEHSSRVGGGGSRRRQPGVEVEGHVTATVTRTCVRTNEDFQVDYLKLPLRSIVRPAVPLSDMLSSFGQGGSNNKGGGGRRQQQQQRVDEILDIQEDVENSLMEDEAIYPVNGSLDVGELVAQLFWLKLDPYPKKPGSNPIRTSISG